MFFNNFKNNTGTLLIQYGNYGVTGNVAGGKSATRTIPLNINYTNTYFIPMAIHRDGNQINVSISGEDNGTILRYTNSFKVRLRNVNAETKADIQGVFWFTIGKA